MRFGSLMVVSLLGLVASACPGPSTADAGDGSRDAAGDDADSAVIDPDVVTRPDVLRCGPGAVPFEDDVGACAVAMPVPDGGVPPAGVCTATVNAPTGTLRANELDGTAVVLPDGHRIERAQTRLTLEGIPLSMLRIPGTNLAVVSDGGYNTERLRVMDLTSTPLAVVAGGEVAFPRDGSARQPALFYGLAYDATAHVLYASGGGSNIVHAFDLSATGALSANPARAIDLGITESMADGYTTTGQLQAAYPSGLALSSDGTQLAVALQRGHSLAIIDTANPASRRIVNFPIPDATRRPFPYAVVARPGDPQHVYVSLWGQLSVAEVDLGTAAITRTFVVGKNPEELLFSTDGARLYVAASDSDAINVIDLSMPAAPVRTMYLGGGASAPRGIEPTALAWGPSGRLYVVEANDNAIDVLDGTTLARIGRIATEWYPTDVEVLADGSVVVTTAKGLGSGPNRDPANEHIDDLLQGSIARYAAPDDAALRDGDAAVTRGNSVGTTFNDVTCPAGAAYDFPVPRPGSGASSRIHHVVLVVRENKTYDALLGDYAGATGNPANGDATLTLAPAAMMDRVVPNFRALARSFANADNYYSNAEQSLQGHTRTVHGRTNDYTERTWVTSWGRATRSPPNQGLTPIGMPEEGSVFTAMLAAHVPAEAWGEGYGAPDPTQFVAARYPGIVALDMNTRDILRGRAFADWAQGTNNIRTNPTRACRLPGLAYICLPDDHTNGLDPGSLTPQSFIQDNDEGTGFLVDGVSHSPFWVDTLVVVIEDDPGDWGDHVDNHRSVALLISPWVRRGYTSHVHYDESSVLHTIELILGVPPHNAAIASAAPMYDMFTSTPDFAPYRYTPRMDCETRNPMSGRYAPVASQMDFQQLDNAPGLTEMVWASFHGGARPPFRTSSPRAAARDDDDD